MDRKIGETGCSTDDIIASFKGSPEEAVVLVQGWLSLAEKLKTTDSKQDELKKDLFYKRKNLLEVVKHLLDDWKSRTGTEATIYKLIGILETGCHWKDLATILTDKCLMRINWEDLDDETKQRVLASKIKFQGSVMRLDQLLVEVENKKDDILWIAMNGPLIFHLLNNQETILAVPYISKIYFIGILEALMLTGPDFFAVDSKGNTMVHRGVERLQDDELHAFVDSLLKKELKELFYVANSAKLTPMHYIFGFKYGTMWDGHLTAEMRYKKILPKTLQLLHSKLDISLMGDGTTVLRYAINGMQPRPILELIAKLFGGNPRRDGHMLMAAYWGNVEAIEYLASMGANVNERDGNGETPLHYFVHGVDWSNHTISAALIKHGADTTIADRNGWIALRPETHCY